jgi:hypothetical protein
LRSSAPTGTSGSVPRRRVTRPRSAPGAALSDAPPVSAGLTGGGEAIWAPAAGATQADAPHRAAASSAVCTRAVGIGPRSVACGVS